MYEEIDPRSAHERQQQGWVYVDVRSPQEFAQGHPEGAVNIPILFMGPLGMTPNEDFAEVVQRRFPPDRPLLLGCKSGGRSARAAMILAQHGYQQLANVAGGFDGAPGVHGWSFLGLPSSTDLDGVSWEAMKQEATR